MTKSLANPDIRSDGCEGKTIPVVVIFLYDRGGFEGYLGNICLDQGQETLLLVANDKINIKLRHR